MQDDRDDRGFQRRRAVDSEVDRSRRLGLDPVAETAEGALGREQAADARGQVIEGGVPPTPRLDDRLDLGAVLVVVAERRERHRRLAGIAVAQDQQARRRHALGQNLAAQHGRRLGLQERVKRLLDDADVDPALGPARMAQEIALLADRSDVTEELVRLASHLDQASALITGTGSVGRRLDFLVQEIGRELNTIGSKSTLTEISAAVVDAKAVLEKVREQVQNVE